MTTPNGAAEALTLLTDLIAAAKRAGADAADAVYFASAGLSASVRLGQPEDLERSESIDLGLRALIGRRQALVSSSDTRPETLKLLVERAVAMAKAAPEDPYCGLADEAALAKSPPDLDLLDATEPTEAQLIERARAAEEAARAVPGVTNSEGAGASFYKGLSALATSTGFAGAYSGSRHGHSVEVIAGKDGALERDYDFSSACHLADLTDAAAIGLSAGNRAVKRLNARKIKSGAYPVVYDARCSGSLVGHLAQAINATGIARGTSFLKDKMGGQIFAAGISIIDDPLRPRGLRSHPFDGEAMPGQKRAMVDGGRLTSWFLDCATARQLQLKTTGHASRGSSSPPSPSASNLYLAAGGLSVEELIADIREGLLVTELMGSSVNGITGDYSRGATGFWIDQGEIAYPVSEITVAGNLKEMFLNLRAANDLNFRLGVDCPTVRIEGMVVAGN